MAQKIMIDHEQGAMANMQIQHKHVNYNWELWVKISDNNSNRF